MNTTHDETMEKILGVLAADDDESRIQLVQVAAAGQVPTLEVRHQRHGGELGWVTHKRIKLAAGQIGEVHQALGLMDIDAREAEISPTRKASARSLRLVSDENRERSSG